MKLYYREYGSGPPLVILHGLFGSSDNWATLAKKFGADFRVITVDLRNHGRSPHTVDMDYSDMADDIKTLADDLGLSRFNLMGHSMGGKTAMAFTDHYPESLSSLIVVDIAPKAYPIHHDQLIEAMKSVPLENLESRKEAENSLRQTIANPGILQFLLKNLARDEQGFKWKINLSALEQNLEVISGGFEFKHVYEGRTLFLRGGKSDYILDEDWPAIQTTFPHAALETMPGIGHWLHAENPEDFYNRVMSFLKSG